MGTHAGGDRQVIIQSHIVTSLPPRDCNYRPFNSLLAPSFEASPQETPKQPIRNLITISLSVCACDSQCGENFYRTHTEVTTKPFSSSPSPPPLSSLLPHIPLSLIKVSVSILLHLQVFRLPRTKGSQSKALKMCLKHTTNTNLQQAAAAL